MLRISLIPLGEDNNFSFKEVQFPIHICFTMPINKSQCQTLLAVELHLEEFCLSHKQVNVGCSRVEAQQIYLHLFYNGKIRILFTMTLVSYYDILSYPPLFVNGEDGYHFSTILTNSKTTPTKQIPVWTSISNHILQLLPQTTR